MKRHMLIYFFIFRLVGKERGEIFIRIRDSYKRTSEIVLKNWR